VKRLIGKRLALGGLTLAVVSILIFLIIRNIPGDPIGVLLQQNGSPEVRRTLEAYYGLDRPVFEQYMSWLGHVFQGDFGRSIFTGEAVSGILMERYVRTLYLMVGGLTIALLIAVPLGLLAASRQGRTTDVAVTSTAIGLQSLPEFWLGSLLVLLFGVQLQLLPTSGFVSPSESLSGFFEHAILPMVTVGAILSGLLVRSLRSSLVEQLRQDYVTTALAQGVPYRRIVRVHALRNSLVPTLTLIGVQVGILMGGAVIVEKVFSYPGMGLMLVDALQKRDYPLVQGALLLFAATFIVVNLIADVCAILLDPKNRGTVAA
jgi:peptide/nickel transport system permease protein